MQCVTTRGEGGTDSPTPPIIELQAREGEGEGEGERERERERERGYSCIYITG